MGKILFATTNPGKLNEAKTFLEKEGIAVLSLKDFPGIKYIEETGETFYENAVLKAKGYFKQTNVPTIGNDGGLVIDALGGAPGVHSHRFLGRSGSTQEFAEAIIEKMKGIPKEKRTAHLGGVMVFWDGSYMAHAESWIEGYITEKIEGKILKGLPYRSILFVTALQKIYSDITDEEKIHFRIKNLEKLKKDILEHI